MYIAYNAAVPTTAAMVHVSTGTAIKTLLQLTAPAAPRITVVEWGITFDGAPSAIVCELIETTTVAGTGMTAVTPTPLTDGAPASLVTAGFSPSAEGTVAATTRTFDYQKLSVNNYKWEWSLGREPIIKVSSVLRVRVTATAAVNAICWIRWTE
jgi:hypothetical protein